MEIFVAPSNATVVDIKGMVQTGLGENSLLNVGDQLQLGTEISVGKDSEITLAYDDGSQQRITSHTGIAGEELNVENIASGNESTTASTDTPDGVLDDIAAIQALIESGDDIELPDTAAGGLVGNEGTGFITLDRNADETLAQAGFDTAEQDNNVLPTDQPETAIGISQPTLTESDQNIIEEDTVAQGNVLDNDSDLDDVLTVQSYTVAGDPTVYLNGQTAVVEGGSLIINTDGSYSFTPLANWNGVLPTVTYTTNTNASETLDITVTPVSDLTDDNEAVVTLEDTTITGNVLANAATADNPLSVTSFTIGDNTFNVGTTAALAEGDLTLNADGSYTFIPTDNYNDAVPVVTYTVLDGAGDTVTSTLSISITPVADIVDGNEEETTLEDTTLTGNVLDNASSPDNPLSVTSFTIDGNTFAVGSTAELPEGKLTLNADGSYIFVPTDNYNDAVPVVTYTVIDGEGDTVTSTLTISITPVADIVDGNEEETTLEDTTLTGNVLDNASSPDNPITVTSFTIGDSTFTVGSTAELPEGRFTLNADGSYIFVPTDNYNDAVPVVTYTVIDGEGDTDTSTLSIDIIPVSDLTDGNEAVSVQQTSTVTGNVLDNASSPDAPLSVINFTIGNDTYAAGDTAVLTEGTLTLNADGSYNFDPTNSFSGSVPDVNYTVTDGEGDIDNSTLSITVTAPPPPPPPPPPVDTVPDANNDINTVVLESGSGNEVASVTVTGNIINASSPGDVTDTSADGTIILTQVSGEVFVNSSTPIVIVTEFGTLTIFKSGAYSYTSKDGMALPDDTVNDVFTYTIQDGDAVDPDSDTATLTINIRPPGNIPPVAADDTFSVNEDGAVSGNVITHDDGDGVIDIDGDDGTVLSVTHVNGTPVETTGFTEIPVEGGTLSINALGQFTYTKTGGFDLEVDTNPTFTYTLSDGATENSTDTGTVTINVIDSAPVAVDDTNSISQRTIRGNVIKTFDDAGEVVRSSSDRPDDLNGGHLVKFTYDGVDYNLVDGLSITILTAHGTLTVYGKDTPESEGSYTFSREGATIFTASTIEFKYTIQDGDTNKPEFDIGTLTISVGATEAPTPEPAPFTSTDDSGEISFSKVSTIDTSMVQEDTSDNIVNVHSFGNEEPLDLSDLLSEERTDSLDKYLALNEDHQEAAALSELSEVENAALIEQDIVLGGDKQAEDHQNITNGLLADGAIIVSDTAAPTAAPLVEMDSSELV
ncbi:MAG: retention module-containing protein [Colwellia sp.]|nr:retention module-containing protein [Colwellia sp.]